MKSSIFFKKIESFLKQNLQKIKKIATVAMAFFLTSMGIRTLAEENKVENIVKDDSKSQNLEIKEGSFPGSAIIEINKPNKKGVSHNYYKKFDMESDDRTIFNNIGQKESEKPIQISEDLLLQNPNFDGAETGASVIINEITGGSKSSLAGTIEVGGRKADLIFANENGIKVNDQKYYNVGKVIFGNSIKDIEKQKEHSHSIRENGKSISDDIEKIKEKIKDIKEKIEKEKIKDINKNIEEMEKRIKISKKESEIIKSLEKELKKEIKNLEIAKAFARTANPSMYENKIIIKPSSKDGYNSLYSLQRVNAKTLEIDKKTGAIASKGQDDLSLPVVYGQRIDSAALPTMASTKVAQDASNQIKYISSTQKTDTKSDGINFNKSKDDLSLDDASFTGILPVALTMVSPAQQVYKTAKQTKDTQESDTPKTRSIKIKSSNGSAKNGIEFKKGEADASTTQDFTPVSLASAATGKKTEKLEEQLDNTQLSDEAKTVKTTKAGNDSHENTLEFKVAEVATSSAQKLTPVPVPSEANTEKKVDTPIKKLNHIEVADTTKTQLEKVEGHDKSTLVQIAKTNSNGISHNLYNEFSIESDENVLLNNNSSGGKVGSKLLNGKEFSSNKNLDGKSASLIINEVGMNDRGATKLAGGLEVLGTKSDVIIANENGIIVNGGRFENVGELTLSSGKYRMSDSSGKQHAFSDNDGKVLVNANTKVDKLSIVDSGQIEISKEATLDSNRLFLQANKNLSNQGKITGKSTRVLSKGDIVNDGEINSNDVFVSGKNLINKGKIDSTLSTTVKGRNLQNYGEITSKNYVDLTAGTGFNKGKVTSKNVKATLDNYQNEGVLSAKDNLAIYSNDKLVNKKEISGNVVQISGDYIENTDGAFISAKDGLKIEGKILRNDSSAIVSDKQLYIDAQDEIQNVNEALIHSNGAGTIRSKKILNVASQISSKENLRLQANELENTGKFNYELKNEGYNKLTKHTNVRESMWKAWYNGYTVEVKIPKESVNIDNISSLIHSDKNVVISAYDNGKDKKTKVYNRDSSIVAKESAYIFGDLNNLTTTKTRQLANMLHNVEITLTWDTNSLVNGGIFNSGKDAENVSLLRLLTEKNTLRKYQYWNLLKSINDPGLDKLMSLALGSDWKAKDDIPDLINGKEIEYYSANSRGQVLAQKNIFVKGDVYNDSISTDETLLSWEKNRDTKDKKGIYEKAGEISAGNDKYPKFIYSKDAQESLKKIEKNAKQEDTLGKIKAGNNLIVDAQKFNNKNSQIFAGNNLITLSEDFTNEGSKNIKTDIVAKGQANIKAKENVKLELSEIIADQGLDIQAKNIDLLGADLYSMGGDINLEAEEKVNVEDRIEKDSEKIIENERTTTTNETTELTRETESSKASSIKGKNVNISAGDKAKVKGSDIKAEEKAKIKAKEVDIESSETKDIEKITNQSGGKYKLGLPELAAFKSKSTEQTTQNASTIKANNVVVEAENDINVKGSDIIAKGNVDLKAGGKVNVEDAKETEKTKEGALSIGLVGSTYYNKKEEKGKSRASNIIAGGKVNIDGEEDVDITGSNIKGSGGDIVSRKKKVNFNAVEETHKVTETETSVGFVGSASAGIGDLGAKAEFDSAHNKASTEIINNYAPKKDRGNKQARSKLSSLASGEIGLKISNNKTEIEDKKWKNGTLEASEGSFNIKGKEQVDIGGTDITTKKRLDITAGKVESKVYKDTHKEKTTGFSLTAKQSVGATSSILDAVNSSKEITEDAMKGQLNGGLAALKAAGAVTNLLFNDTVGSNSKQELGFNYTDSNKEVTKDKKSRIKAGEGISITATEEDVNLNNVDIESKGDVDLTAKRDVNVAGGEINEKSTNNNFSAEIHTQQTAGVSAIFGSNVQAGGGASFDYERGSEESTKHTNSKIKGKNVRINAGRDVNVKGAEIRADKKAKVKAERDLNVETPVDTYNTSKIKANASATLSAGLGSNTIGAGNVSASAGGGYIYGNGEKISQRSSITAGEEFEAEVGNNLNLDSATIGSDTKKGSLKVEGETKITERVLKEQAGGAIVGISGGITGELGLDLEIGDKKDKQVAQNSVISLAKENISSGKIKLNGEEVKADSLKTDKKEESKTLKDVFEKGGSASLSFSVKDTKELLGKVRPRSKRSTQESGQKSSGDYEDISGAFSGRNEAESKRAQERIDDSSREARQEPIYAQIDPSKKTPKVESETEKQARIAQENTQKYGPKESVVSPDNATYMTIQRKGRVEEAANKAQRELPKLPGEDVKTQKSLDVETTKEKIYEDPYSIISNKNDVDNKRVKESDYEDLDKFRETLSSNRERIENSLREARQEPIYAQIDPSKKTPKVESETEKQARIAQENTQKYGPKESVVSPDNDTYMTIQRKGRVEEAANKAQRELPKLPGEDVKIQKSLDVETTKEKIYEDPYSIISNKNDVDNKRVKESDYEDLDVLRSELKNINYKMADGVDFGAFKAEAEGKKYKTGDTDLDKSNKFEDIPLDLVEELPTPMKLKSEYHGLIEGAGSGVTKDNVFNEKYVTINDKIVAITNTNYTPKQLSAEERNRRFDEVKKKAEKLNPHKEAVDKLKKIANDANDIPKEAIISKLNELRDGYSNEQVMELVNKSAQENSKIVAPDTFDPNKLTPSERSEIGKVFNKTPLSNEYNDFRKNVDQKIYEKLKENPKFVELMNSNLSGNQEKLKELFKIVSESKRDAFKEVGGIDIPTPNLELLSSSKKHKHIHGDYSGDLVRMNDVAPIPSKEKSAQNKELLNTIIHELTHHDQAYLAENRNNANLRQDLKLDADMFSLNQNLYVHKGKDYKKQPLESDAFNAGDSLSDRLMKDVYKDNSSSFGNTDYKPKKISDKEKKKLEKKAKKNSNSEFTDTYNKFRENADTRLLENLSADPQFKKLMSSEINGNPEKVKELVDIVSRAKKNSLEQLGETNIPKSELRLKQEIPTTSKTGSKEQQNTEILNNVLKQYTYKFSEANGENLVKKISEQKTDKINDGIGNTKYVPEKLSKQEQNKLFKEAKEKAKNRNQAKEAEAKLALLAKNSKNIPKEHLLKAVNEIAYGLGMQDSVELIKKSSETGLKINRPVVIEGFEGKNVKNMGEVLKNIKFDESYIKAREEINKKIVEKLDSSKEFHDLMKEKLSGNEEGIKKLFDMVESAKRESLKEVTGIKGKKATLELNKENGPLSMKQGYYSDNEVHMNVTPIISFLRTKKQNNKEILDTIVHELTHHDQAQITGNKNKKLPDAIKADADLLSLNESYYINSDLTNFSAYKNQPLEREAFISGHKLGEQLSKLVDKGYTGDKTEVKEIKTIEHLPNKINNLESPKSAQAELGDNALIYGLKYGRQELIGKANEADKEGKNPTLADSYIGKLNLGFEFANLTDFAKKLNKGEVTDADIADIANFQDPGAAHARKTESRSRINAANSDDNKKIMTELLKNEKAVDSLKKVGELSEKVDNVFTEMRKNEFLDLDNPKESSHFTDEQNKQIREYNELQTELNNARMDFFTEKTKLIAKETLERGGKLYFALDGLATDSTSFTKNTKIDMDRLKDLFDEKNPYYNAVTSRELRYLYENYKDNPNLKFTIKDHVIENPLKTLEIKPSNEEAGKKDVQKFEKKLLPELKNPFAKKANGKNEVEGKKQALQSEVSGFGNTDYKPKKISDKEKKKLEKKAKKNSNSEFTDTYNKFRENADTRLLENLSADPQFKKLMSSEINGNPEKVKELVDIVSRAKKNSLEQLGETNIPKSELRLKQEIPTTSKTGSKEQQNTEILNNVLKQYTYKFSEANGENLVKKISEQKTDKINDGIGNTKYVPEKLSKQEQNKLFKEAKEKAKNRNQAKEAEAKLALLAKNSKNIPKEHLLKAVNEIAYGLGMQDSVELIKKSSETGLKINRPVVIEGFEGKNVKNMGEVLKNIKFDESYIKAREEINKKIVEKLDSSKEFHDLMKEKLSGNEEGIKKLFDMVESAKRESLKEVTGIKGKKATLELNKENGPLSMKQGYYSDNEVHMNVTPIISFLRTKKQNNKEILDTIVHELTHHDQAQITGNKNKKLPDAIKADADLLSLNESYYINSDLTNFSAYKNQPLEREAFISGHKLGEQLSKLVDKGYTGDKTEVKEIKTIEHLPNKINNLESPKSAQAELGDNALIYGLKYGRQELIGKANEADKEGKNPTLADSYIGKLNLGFEFANLTDFAKKLNKGEVTDADIADIANFQDPGAAHARKTESRSRINAANSDDNKKIMTELLKNEKAVDSLKKVGELSEKVDNVFTEMRKNEFLDLDNPKESSHFTDEQNKQIREYNELQTELNNARMDFFTEKTKLIAKETLERGGKLYFALDGLATDSTSFTKNTKIDMDRLKDLFDEKNPYYNAVTSRELRYLYENYKDNPNLKFTIKDHVIENPLKTLEIKPSK
ncbi:hypothetical protein BFG04_04815 [Campylobacter pinnipediorum subsp. pinnipediorum]|uniref:Filamentous haemagglutinin FhaB/tRNA nuclease CdiA-like TPS domain-containing protein n=1 Tax=Campylobacter pinnipediorum subsp. pinnipediorum TaxID=1660067 RepID=A0AAX0L8H3_9BACT|nr:hemagglutinin repeat-containing protein [Campylobacter pinnipediorum]OPA76411.1 hypothetical protein BFG04_04815 [Campylobacter pinnipediorum subsp. pinnipediorum]